jgi:hypothetical protein
MAVFVANTNLLELTGLKDDVAGTFINDAAVTATVVDEDGQEVAGMVWPVTLDYVGASNGDYRAVLSDGLSLVPYKRHVARIDADAGPDRVGHWEFDFLPQTRS